MGAALATRLHAPGVRVTRVHAAAGFERLAADAFFAVRAGSRADHAQVLAALRADGLAPPQVVLHLWNVTAQAADATQAEVRISTIVDARFRLIVDGESGAVGGALGKRARCRSDGTQSSTISVK